MPHLIQALSLAARADTSTKAAKARARPRIAFPTRGGREISSRYLRYRYRAGRAAENRGAVAYFADLETQCRGGARRAGEF